MNDDFDDELTPVERRAYASLPREAAPNPELEERVVAMLRARGHLPTPISVARGGRTRRPAAAWLAGAVAAGLTLFVTGLAVGQYIGSRNVAFAMGRGSAQSTTEVAARVQRAGSLYVAALASLSSLPDGASPAARDSVRAVAVRVLGQAAQEMALIAPDDPLAAAVLRGLNQRDRQQSPAVPSRSVMWY